MPLSTATYTSTTSHSHLLRYLRHDMNRRHWCISSTSTSTSHESRAQTRTSHDASRPKHHWQRPYSPRTRVDQKESVKRTSERCEEGEQASRWAGKSVALSFLAVLSSSLENNHHLRALRTLDRSIYQWVMGGREDVDEIAIWS